MTEPPSPARSPFHLHTEHLPPPLDPDTQDPARDPQEIFSRGFTRPLTPHEHQHYGDLCRTARPDWMTLQEQTHRWIRRVIINPPLAAFCVGLPTLAEWFNFETSTVLYSAWPYLPASLQQRLLTHHAKQYAMAQLAIYDQTLPVDRSVLSTSDIGCCALATSPDHFQHQWWSHRLKRIERSTIGELLAYLRYPAPRSPALPLSPTRWIHPDDPLSMKQVFQKLLASCKGQEFLNNRTRGFYLFPHFDLRPQALQWTSPEKQLRLWQIFASLPPDQCLHLTPPTLDEIHVAIITTRLAARPSTTDLPALTRWISSYHRPAPVTTDRAL